MSELNVLLFLFDAFILGAMGKVGPDEFESLTVLNTVTLGKSPLSPVSLFVKWWIYKILRIFVRLNNMVLVFSSRKSELMQRKSGDSHGNILQCPKQRNVTSRLGQTETSGC